MKYATRILHNGNELDPRTGALSIPIYQASTFHQPDVEHPGAYDYSRSGNPTREALENTLAALENGTHAYAFASGMAATASALSILEQGDHIVATEDIYGGSYRVLNRFFNKFGLETSFVDMTRLENIEAAIRPNTKALFLETPSNPLLKITDIRGAVAIAKAHGLLTLLDNTFMSPYFQRPLDLGVDIVVHSATKFLGGHSDVIGGAAITRSPELAKRIYFVQNGFGAILGPQDSWLLLRGIKTLRARMELQQQAALFIAEWLRRQNWVTAVYYPGLPDHPGQAIHRGQASGHGAVLSFKTDAAARALAIMKQVKLWSVAVSLGGVESILSYPVKMSHASLPASERERLGITADLIRLSVGLEDPEDLVADLEAGIR
ncbi:cystathionine beta-lyase [Hydrogenispora ethanolica]|uniref:cysteine-S-conjugate beta-lyase n=1 Tax=Hydrogenispora ethanolica TaxID=1082276 RepID=A0A4R1S3T6_HYDET|nr:PLP-dependent aspartate aminotransferase family protein [Hydrogenispora ethanolica]TCL73330.1 cystathionine beta-lyase [Hydrogenispora ethanolica]